MADTADRAGTPITSGPRSRAGDDPVITITDLSVEFPTALGVVRALNGVTFDVARHSVLGVVGESGCGKSVTARAMLQIIEPPGHITGGQIRFRPGGNAVGPTNLAGPDDGPQPSPPVESDGTEIDLTTLHPRSEEIRHIRGGQISMIFQEPMTSLNPVYTIGQQISEAVLLHQTTDKAEAHDRAVDMLGRVGMPNPERVATNYPHQLSGGMRQRAMIAMALSCMPTLLIADEPTTALDVTTEAQILQLMRNLQDEYGMSIMFITHSMGVVAQLCDEVVVMYLGRVVERAAVEDLFYDPKHPYTISLLRSIPRIGLSKHGPLEVIKGGVPDPYTTVPGCPFHPRCPSAITGLCDTVMPRETTSPVGSDHTVRCHLYPGSTPEEAATRQPPPTTRQAPTPEAT